jgi:hypothetical protein
MQSFHLVRLVFFIADLSVPMQIKLLLCDIRTKYCM